MPSMCVITQRLGSMIAKFGLVLGVVFLSLCESAVFSVALLMRYWRLLVSYMTIHVRWRNVKLSKRMSWKEYCTPIVIYYVFRRLTFHLINKPILKDVISLSI